jgi:hypothetical protein
MIGKNKINRQDIIKLINDVIIKLRQAKLPIKPGFLPGFCL